jgi:hypothetical protein
MPWRSAAWTQLRLSQSPRRAGFQRGQVLQDVLGATLADKPLGDLGCERANAARGSFLYQGPARYTSPLRSVAALTKHLAAGEGLLSPDRRVACPEPQGSFRRRWTPARQSRAIHYREGRRPKEKPCGGIWAAMIRAGRGPTKFRGRMGLVPSCLSICPAHFQDSFGRNPT